MGSWPIIISFVFLYLSHLAWHKKFTCLPPLFLSFIGTFVDLNLNPTKFCRILVHHLKSCISIWTTIEEGACVPLDGPNTEWQAAKMAHTAWKWTKKYTIGWAKPVVVSTCGLYKVARKLVMRMVAEPQGLINPKPQSGHHLLLYFKRSIDISIFQRVFVF